MIGTADQAADAWASVEARTARVPGASALWAWGFEGDRTASGVPLFIVRYRGRWAGEATRLGQGRWSLTAVVRGEAQQGEATTLDAGLAWVAETAVL